MAVRSNDDNVIYANFGKKTRVSTPPPAPKRRVVAETHQQAFLRDIYYTLADDGRISRGKSYARNGNVVSISVSRDRVVADVAGSQNEPFGVNIVFPHRSAEELETVTAALLESSSVLGEVRSGKLPPAMVGTLLAEQPHEVRLLCECPDYSGCCKHAIAVLEVFADKVEKEPALLFELRGLSFAQLELSMQAAAKKHSEVSSGASNESFWEGGELPLLPNPKTAPAIDDSDLDALHKAMRSISYTSIDELRAVSDIEDLYHHLTHPR
ncbi:SWIM zinc finger family protein [Corynebacterium sp. H128]|uniref:SWIM zinc finger family protein n=1 Tax=Corynebacterium sp. H128 TaxID=3133427 RepID=UPI0030AB4525